MFTKIRTDIRGNLLLLTLVFGSIGIAVTILGIGNYTISENKASLFHHQNELAFQIAEAGINYYQWHLAHNQTDFQDGTGNPGPYTHTYADKNGNIIGEFILDIIPPLPGSTVVTVKSTGYTVQQPNTKRTITAHIGFASLTDYAFLTNTDVWIGDNEVIHGKLHANGGVRFDGTADAPITSAKQTYVCKAHHGCGNQTKPGIWGAGGPKTFWSFPVPAFDFTGITVDMAKIQSGAKTDGLYLPPSNKQGWHIKFTGGGNLEVYEVISRSCYNGKGIGDTKFKSYCLDIKTENLVSTQSIPANGLIFVEDTAWVNGVVDGRVTVAAAQFSTNPGALKSIIIPDNLTHAAADGTDIIGLMAEQHIFIPHNSPNTMLVEAAVLAQGGSAERVYYPGDMKDSLTISGSIISNGVWTWSWVSGGGAVVSGYKNTDMRYDSNLTYNPPPGFPVGTTYQLINWEEEK